MAIYRPSKPRWRAIAGTATICLLVGGVFGWIMGSARDQDPADAARTIRASLSGARGALEVVEIEYGEAVENGEVVARSEYDGARAAALRARSLYMDAAGALEVLSPVAGAEIAASFEDLLEAIDSTADEGEVATLVRSTADLLELGAP